jgi:ribonuclease P protein component
LTRRADYLRAAKGRKLATPSCVVQALLREADGQDAGAGARVGFTATRKIGGAVVRNRAKRRLREAARLLLPRLGRPGVDYVFIARQETAVRPWPSLLDDVERALLSLAPIAAGRAQGLTDGAAASER